MLKFFKTVTTWSVVTSLAVFYSLNSAHIASGWKFHILASKAISRFLVLVQSVAALLKEECAVLCPEVCVSDVSVLQSIIHINCLRHFYFSWECSNRLSMRTYVIVKSKNINPNWRERVLTNFVTSRSLTLSFLAFFFLFITHFMSDEPNITYMRMSYIMHVHYMSEYWPTGRELFLSFPDSLRSTINELLVERTFILIPRRVNITKHL